MPGFFPSRTVTAYLIRLFLVRTIAVLAVLILVLQALDLLSESDNILAVAGNGQSQLLIYVGLRIPELVQRFLPFCVLLGTLITLATLNQNSEVISMRAAGFSAHQVLAPLFLASFAIAIVSFAFNDRIVSRATATLDRWQAVEYRQIPTGREGQSNVWVRAGDDLIHANFVDGRASETRLRNVTVYNRDNGRLLTVVEADEAVVEAAGWRLRNARAFDVSRGSLTPLGTITVARNVSPDQFSLSNVDAGGLSWAELSRVIDDLKQAGRPTSALEAGLWHKISGPLSTLLMPLLGAVAAFGLARSGRLLIRAIIGMALGFAYFVADNFGLAMGNLGAYPPLIAAWAPFLLFLLIGEAVLIRTEE